jgi:cytochrome c oxidase assembly factor CtaG
MSQFSQILFVAGCIFLLLSSITYARGKADKAAHYAHISIGMYLAAVILILDTIATKMTPK